MDLQVNREVNRRLIVQGEIIRFDPEAKLIKVM